MSDTSRIGISITANDQGTATLRSLQSVARDLNQTLRDVGGTAADAGGKITAALRSELAAVNSQIAALGGQATAIRSVTAAMQEQASVAQVLHRTLQEGINASMGVGTDRQIKSAAESARILATSLGAAAEADARLRNEAIATTAVLERQGAAVRTLTGEQFFGGFQRRMGIGRQPLSAESSAEAFRRELGQAGGGLTLTPAQGFSSTVAELAGVKQSYLSAADSARVFQQAGVTAAESVAAAQVGMKLKVGAGAGGAAFGGGDGGAGIIQRESRHVVGLFDSLARGQKGQAISSIGAAARDAGLGVAALATSMTGLVAILGVAAVVHGAENMGRWATETRAAASAAGMGIESYSRLQGALTLTGVKSTDADAALRRLAVNLSAALANPASLAAQAFHNLGISQEQLVGTGGNAGEALKLLADAFQRNADGAAKSSNMNEIFGRGFEKIIPALQNGSNALADLEAKAESMGLTLTAKTAAAMEKTGESARTLGETISGNAMKAFESWEPVIDGLITLLKGLVDVIGEVVSGLGKLASLPVVAAKAATDYVAQNAGSGHIQMIGNRPVWRPGPAMTDNASSMEGESPGPAGRVPQVTPPPLTRSGGQETVLDTMRAQMAQAANAASQSAKTAQAAREAEGQAEVAVMQKTLQTATLTAKQREQVETELANKQTSLRNSQLAQSDSAGKAGAKQNYADFAQGEQLKIAAAEGSSAKIIATYDEWISAAEGRYKQHVSVIERLEKEKVQAINAARLQEIKEGATDTEQSNRLSGLNATLTQMQKGQYNYTGAPQTTSGLQRESTQALAEAAQVKAAADTEISALTQVRDAAEAGSATQKAASAEIMSVLIQSKTQEIALYKKAGDAAQQAATKAAEQFKQFFDSIGGGFQTFTNSVLKSLISPQQEMIKAGLTTITKSMQGTEIQQAFGQLVNHMASSLADSVESAIGSTIAKALSGGAANTIGELLSQTFSKVLGNITGGALGSVAGTAVGGAAGNAAVSAAITAAATAQTTALTTAITASTTAQTAATTASAATIVAAITTSTATEDTLLAANAVKPSVLGFSYSLGGIVPSAAGGMIAGGTGGTLSILHPQEMVLPRELSLGLQGMIRNNTANVNYSPTINMASRGRQGTGMTRSEFGQIMSLHSGMLAGEARNAMRAGWRP